MWLILAFVSAIFLGFYDASKKASLKDNAVLPVLLLNTIFSTLIFSPFLLDHLCGSEWFDGTFFDTHSLTDPTPYHPESQHLTDPRVHPEEHPKTYNALVTSMLEREKPGIIAHLLVILKAVIVLTSWICGYFGLKHLPLTIVGPINATRPVLVLVGALIFFGEKLNLYQWIGVLLALASIFMMGRAGKKENIDFKSNRWIWCVAVATLTGAISGLYDKFLMKSFNPMFVQSWFNFYQMMIMSIICGAIWYPKRHQTTPFHWSWAIPLISIFICLGDFAYFTSLNDPASMISVVSLVRRSSVIISFLCGVLIFKERNIKAKLLDLGLILLGMMFIWIGTQQ